jgi:hypothetical protein
MATPPTFTAGSVLTATQMNAVGMWKVASTGTTSSSNLIVYNVFTTDYTNYRLVFSEITGSGVTGLNLLWRSGGSTINLSNYYGVRNGFNYASGAISTVVDNAAAAHQICAIMSGNASSAASLIVDVFAPQKNNRTTSITAQGVDARLGANGLGAFSYSGFYNATTAMDGFVLNAGAQTYSNVNVTIYGYNA